MNFTKYAKSHQTTICLELERVSMLLELAGNPDKKLKIIHVAGTNGKGSVCSFVCEGLVHMGNTVGKFSSPELFDVTDTITVNSIPIRADELEAIYGVLSPLCEQTKIKTGKAPSQFEINFVAALIHFVRSECSYAVLECGMGGMGDATNAICDSIVSVITPISLDHQAYLGSTLGEIATNKCGIFKPSSTVITGFQQEEVLDVIQNLSGDRNLIVAQQPTIGESCGFYETVSYRGVEGVTLSLAGVHQAKNAAIASEVLFFLGATDDDVSYALSHGSNPARFEKIGDNVWFDGAHNPDGAAGFVATVNRRRYGGKIIFVVGFMADKDYESALSQLKNLRHQNFEIYAVPVLSNPRSESADNICKCCESLGFCTKAFNNVKEAVAEAQKDADAVFVFGSLYMYKEMMSCE
ncbi:MAG: hypothetical protein E7395_03115 [Ruminococcaceae bacterium]|nr:hypothetical protein [Oscillospiraceae bacterium]